MGLDAPRARLFRGRAENIAAAAAGGFQHPEIEKTKMISGKIEIILKNIFFIYELNSERNFMLFSLQSIFRIPRYVEKRNI